MIRKRDREFGSDFWLAGHAYRPAERVDDVIGVRKPETGSACFRREINGPEAFDLAFVHPDAVVFDDQHGVAFLNEQREGHFAVDRLLTSFDRIFDEVDQDLFELVGIGQDRDRLFISLQLQLDIVHIGKRQHDFPHDVKLVAYVD